MAFGSTHARLTRTSSDLRILSASLRPPSPILKADDLLISSTSGEIPILLEGTTRVCDSLRPSCGEPTGMFDVTEDSKLIDNLDTIRNTRKPVPSDVPSLQGWIREAKSDDASIAMEHPNAFHADSPSESCSARGVSDELEISTHPVYHDAVLGRSSPPGDDQFASIFGKQGRNIDFEALRDPRASRPFQKAVELKTSTVAPKGNIDGDQLLMITTFHTYSTLPTPTFAPPSPSPSTDVTSPLSSPISRQRHRRPLERSRAVRLPGRPKSPRLQASDVEANLAHSTLPTPTKHATYPRWQLNSSPSTLSTYWCTPDTHASDTTHPFVKHVALPEELSWLKHIVIELWIDQEGFRAVRPCMQLVGYSPRARSLHPYDTTENLASDITAGVAEFMPTKREIFAFHYATLDGPPTLRMVSVGGDESRDYISRQATLSVKVNGVYTVLGTETFLAPVLNGDAHGSRFQNVRLRWKFDYLVSDRKVDATGKTLPGEKTLTPLTFSCSPYLFHPSQGKKTGLMHIMKKNLLSKLVSQKLEPPACAPGHTIPRQPSRHLSTWRNAGIHARSCSDASSESGHHSLTRSPEDTGVGGGTMRSVNHIQYTRRRRASSVGENSLTILKNEPGRGGIVSVKQVMPMASPTTRRLG